MEKKMKYRIIQPDRNQETYQVQMSLFPFIWTNLSSNTLSLKVR
ncbi:hypothetical protein [Caulobacter phage Cr30]|nr:hypothetical protein OZ74_gp201 [Caulobacter phage Cr30]AGS81142.1 hypothetical protein [Caulobacter phage Cr30]